jgi:hypothetical protein
LQLLALYYESFYGAVLNKLRFFYLHVPLRKASELILPVATVILKICVGGHQFNPKLIQLYVAKLYFYKLNKMFLSCSMKYGQRDIKQMTTHLLSSGFTCGVPFCDVMQYQLLEKYICLKNVSRRKNVTSALNRPHL